MDLGTIIGYIIIGLIAGAIAGYLVPGRTPGVGIVGAILGGWLMELLFDSDPAGWIGSIIVAIIGAVIVLFALRKTNVT